MAYAPIHVQNCLAYITDDVFKGATLGTYVEWWATELGRRVDKQGTPFLVVRISGSPLSGGNKCLIVKENGEEDEIWLERWPSTWHTFMTLCRRYNEGEKPEEPYCLEEVICRLTGRVEDCMKYINERLDKWR